MTNWTDQIYFKSGVNKARVGGVGILYNDSSVPQKIYLGFGHEPWNNGITLDNNGDVFVKGKMSVNQIVNRNPFAVLASNEDNSQAMECGVGSTDVYIHNKKANTYLQIKNDNSLQYNNYKIYHEGYKPSLQELGVNDNGFMRREEIGQNHDWNSIIWQGTYKVQMANWGDPNITHAPCTGYSFGLLNVFRSSIASEDRIYQEYIPHREDQPRWFRMCNSQVWQEWQPIDVRKSADSRYTLNCIRIYEGSLNKICKSGFYAVSAVNVDNVPLKKDGRMIVSAWNWGSWSSQIYLPDGGEIYYRISLDQDGTNWTNWCQLYNTKFKPSPSDIGAISKTGDTITGTLNFYSNGNEIEIKNPNNSGQARGVVYKNTSNQIIGMVGAFFTSQNDISKMYIGATNEPWTGVNSFSIDKNFCYFNNKKIYHEGNKPSPLDIGAVSKTGDTITGILNVGKIALRDRDLCINGKRALVGFAQDDLNQLYINYDKDYGNGVIIKGTTKIYGGSLEVENGIKANLNPILIPSNADFNNYKTSGMYYCPSDESAKTMKNIPQTNAFSLLVESHAGVKQTFTCYWKDAPKTFVRNYYAGEWGKWILQVDSIYGPNGAAWEDTSNYWGKAAYIRSSDGVMEIGKYVDFHESNVDSSDYSIRLESRNRTLNCSDDFSAHHLWARGYLRINDWNGGSEDGRLWFKQDGHQMVTENVSIFKSENIKANQSMSIKDYPVPVTSWGSGDPNNSDGLPRGSIYFKI